jgi:acyl-CoA synthetase (AMP-forming)/AMP-acid ligase II
VTFSAELTELASRFDSRIAIAFNGETEITFRALDDHATQFASALLASGLSTGDRVGIYLKNRPEYFVAMFGLARAGMVAVPLNRRAAPAEVAAIIRDAEVRLLVTETGYESLLETALEAASVRMAIVVGDRPERERTGVRSYGEFMVIDASDVRLPDVRDDEVQAIHYTSGTTGTARGVVRTHRANLAVARGALEAIPCGEGVAWFHTLPMNSVGIYAFALAPLLMGGYVVITEDVDPDLTLRLAETYKVKMLHAVPTVWEMLMRVERGVSALSAISSVQMAIWGGSPLSRGSAERLERWINVPCVGCYGSTEAPCMSYSNADIYRSGRFNSSGPPVGGMEIRVVSEEGKDLPAEAWGEVLISGPMLMSGYLNKPEMTKAAIDARGWYRTGDWGRLDRDGSLTVTDRTKDMLISGGENVYPGEIENVISALPGVAEVAVIGVPDDLWGQVVWACVVRNSFDLDEEAIIASCRKALAGFKSPRRVHFFDDLPKNATGKILKTELVKWAQSNSEETA